MAPEGVKTEANDKIVTEKFANNHLKIGIDSLQKLISNAQTVKHLRF